MLEDGEDLLHNRCCIPIWPTNREERKGYSIKYTDLKYEILMWNLNVKEWGNQGVYIVPAVIGALRMVSKI